MLRYELSSLVKVRRARLPFETSSTNENRPQKIETFLGVVECLLKKPNASGLCIKIDAQYAWIVVDKVVNNDWLLWNSLNKLFCDGLRLEDKISCLRYEKTSSSSTECNVIPVHRAFKIKSGEFFTLQNTASPFLAYGMFLGKEVVYFSYPIFTRYPIKKYLHTIRGRPLVLSTRNTAPHDVIYWVRCHDLILEARVSKISNYLRLNSLWKDDQFVYTFGEGKSDHCAIQSLPPNSLQMTWFWSVFLYPSVQKNVSYHHLRDKA